MATYLSEVWAQAPVDPLAEAFAAAGGTVVLGRVITGGPDGEVRFTARVTAGSVTYESGVSDDAQVTLTDTAKNARALLAGELEPNAAFMRGQTKTAGETGVLLAMLAAASGQGYQAARSAALAATDA